MGTGFVLLKTEEGGKKKGSSPSVQDQEENVIEYRKIRMVKVRVGVGGIMQCGTHDGT